MSNIFEVDNARNEGPNALAANFVWTPVVDRLISKKNHIVLGARGSGKTAIAKMLSHPFLSRSDASEAKGLIESRGFIACYVPLRLEWVSSLGNKVWLTDADKDAFFSWRLNLTSCVSFLKTISSCLAEYSPDLESRIRSEYEISNQISIDFLMGENCSGFQELAQRLENFEFDRQRQYLEARFQGKDLGRGLSPSAFDVGLFDPLRRMIAILKRHVRFPDDCSWVVCLDEAEFLDERFQVILNSTLRTESSGLHFKIYTMPYRHLTSRTLSGVPLSHGDDFEYVYIDNGFGQADSTEQRRQEDFVQKIFSKRLRSAGLGLVGVELFHLLGGSELLADDEPQNLDVFLSHLEMYANAPTLRRANEIKGTKGFWDQIYRKMKGAVMLRDAVSSRRGNRRLGIYSGIQVLVKCSDANPRRVIGLLNKLMGFASGDISKAGFRPIPKNEQHAVFKQYSASILSRVRGDFAGEVSVFEFISTIGNLLRSKLHEERLSTDQYFSFEYDGESEVYWPAIQAAIGLGLLYPIVNENNPDQLPQKSGKFYLAYVLSPHFDLLPRKGRQLRLSSLLHEARIRGLSGLKANDQMRLL